MLVTWLQYPFETLQGLSESEYVLSYLKGGMVAAILSQANEDTIFGKLWKNVRNDKLFKNSLKKAKFQNVPMKKDGTTKHEGYEIPTEIDFMSESSRAPTAWIMSVGSAIQLSAYRDCKVVMIPQTFLPKPMSFAYPKNSSLAIIIEHQFWKLKETGAQYRIEKKYTPLAPECRHSCRDMLFIRSTYTLFTLFRDGPYFEREAVSISKVAMATNLFGLGFAISWTLFVIEIIYYNRMRAMRT